MSERIPALASAVSRRQFINTATLAAAGVALANRSAFAQAAGGPAPTAGFAQSLLDNYGKPNSTIRGVRIGVIAPYALPGGTAEDMLKYCVALGISNVELQGEPVNAYVGAGGGGRGGAAGIPGATPSQTAAVAAITTALTPLNGALTTARAELAAASLRVPSNRDEIMAKAKAVADAELNLAMARADQTAKLQASADKLNPQQLQTYLAANGGPQPAGRGGGGRGAAGEGGAPAPLVVGTDPLAPWMNQATLDKVAALGKMYRDAGVSIYAFKRGAPTDSDAQLDYNFQMAKAIGAHHVTLELPTNPAATERMGAFGKKHGIYVGYHTHTQARFNSFDEAFKQSTHNMMNLDVGHYQGGNKTSALPLLQKYPDRVASIHLKDKSNGDQNMVWGQGDTPLIQILQTMRDEKWKFPGTIELEYTPPAGSNKLVEVGRCRAYCAAALMA